MEAFHLPFVVIETDPEIVRAARTRNIVCIFGDPSRPAVLEAAHVERAMLVLVTIPSPANAYLTIRNIRAVNPQVPAGPRPSPRRL